MALYVRLDMAEKGSPTTRAPDAPKPLTCIHLPVQDMNKKSYRHHYAVQKVASGLAIPGKIAGMTKYARIGDAHKLREAPRWS